MKLNKIQCNIMEHQHLASSRASKKKLQKLELDAIKKEGWLHIM